MNHLFQQTRTQLRAEAKFSHQHFFLRVWLKVVSQFVKSVLIVTWRRELQNSLVHFELSMETEESSFCLKMLQSLSVAPPSLKLSKHTHADHFTETLSGGNKKDGGETGRNEAEFKEEMKNYTEELLKVTFITGQISHV